jgi:hypothetical protein
MYTLKIKYDGQQYAPALNKPNHNVIAIDCPFTGNGVALSDSGEH